MIKLENYSYQIGKKKILHNINYQFDNDNVYIIKGRNGSGKTMLLRAITGLITASDGARYIDDEKTDDFVENVGIIIGNMQLIPHLTGMENLEMLNNIDNASSTDKITELLKYFDLYEDKDVNYNKYSLGMKQKINIIQAVMGEQQVLCLDEPLNGLDEVSVEKFMKLIQNIKKDKIIIIATHNDSDFKNIDYTEVKVDNGMIIK